MMKSESYRTVTFKEATETKMEAERRENKQKSSEPKTKPGRNGDKLSLYPLTPEDAIASFIACTTGAKRQASKERENCF